MSKFAKISSFAETDDLFSFICTDIVKVDKNKVKKEILGIPNLIAKKKASIFDVINLMKRYNLQFELKVVYEEGATPELLPEDVADFAATGEHAEKDEMQEQKESIQSGASHKLLKTDDFPAQKIEEPVKPETKSEISDLPDF